MTNTYKSKTIEVQAVQFTEKNKDQVHRWCCSIQMNVYPSFDNRKQPILIIPTLEGEMICSIGDYIIVEPFPVDWRKLYPVKEDVFNNRYTLIDTPIISDKVDVWEEILRREIREYLNYSELDVTEEDDYEEECNEVSDKILNYLKQFYTITKK